jgi:hypothetical protein
MSSSDGATATASSDEATGLGRALCLTAVVAPCVLATLLLVVLGPVLPPSFKETINTLRGCGFRFIPAGY